ncbi:hypothetical protein D3C81_1459360 [compost metagenome]
MPLPWAKSSELRPCVAFFCTMKIDVRSFSISGYGLLVVSWMVYLSITFLLTIALV